MFGYVSVLKDELKIREYGAYRAVYCGVCTACGRQLSHMATLGLSYDAAFAALLLMSVTGEEIKTAKRRCIINPFKSRQYVISESIEYAASAWALLAYYKLLDDWRDSRSLRGLIGMLLFGGAKRKAAKKLPRLAAEIDGGIKKLSALERDGCTDIDLVAAVSGEMLAVCLTPEYVDADSVRPLAELGRNLGRWIYLMDAADDFDRDKRQGSYNLFTLNYGSREEALKQSLTHTTYTLSTAALSYELLDIKANKSLLDNIIYLGLAAKQREVFEGKEKTNESI